MENFQCGDLIPFILLEAPQCIPRIRGLNGRSKVEYRPRFLIQSKEKSAEHFRSIMFSLEKG